jgi:hypothetical protein
MRDNEKLVTIARFDTGFDAEVAKLALDAEGINCHLAGMDLVTNMPYPNVIAVELQVLEGDVERAKEVLGRQADDFDESEEDIEDGQ